MAGPRYKICQGGWELVFLNQWFSKSGLQTSSINTPGNLFGNVNSNFWAPCQTYCIENSMDGAQLSVLTSLPGDLMHHKVCKALS